MAGVNSLRRLERPLRNQCCYFLLSKEKTLMMDTLRLAWFCRCEMWWFLSNGFHFWMKFENLVILLFGKFLLKVWGKKKKKRYKVIIWDSWKSGGFPDSDYNCLNILATNSKWDQSALCLDVFPQQVKLLGKVLDGCKRWLGWPELHHLQRTDLNDRRWTTDSRGQIWDPALRWVSIYLCE